MSQLWSDESRLNVWVEIEIQALKSRAAFGEIPETVALLVEKATQDITISWERVLELEKELKHDVISFLTAWNEQLEQKNKQNSGATPIPYTQIHYGMTSSDVVDTGLSLLCVKALDLIEPQLKRGMRVFERLAREHRHTVCVGRTHGIHGEPTVMGMKFLLWYADFARLLEEWEYVRRQIAVGKLSGAVGTAVHLRPEVEEHFCNALGLEVEPVATQVIQRDRHARLACFLALVGSVLEKISVELRHWQRTEVREAEEAFTKGQKGSSAMPHKKNPISAENLTGCARMLKAQVNAALDNVALWHERDISHSSVERVFVPDAFVLADYALNRLIDLVDRLQVNEDRARQNLELTGGLVFSQKALLVLVEKGCTREEAYAVVQEHGMKVWSGAETRLLDSLLKDPRVNARVKRPDLEKAFDPQNFLQSVDRIYARTFERYGAVNAGK